VKRFRLLVRTAGWAVVLPMLKRALTLPTLTRVMWRPPRTRERNHAQEAHVAALLDRVYRHGRVPRRHNCLERSLIMYRYLSELNADPTLMVALKREAGALRGHAWIVVDGHPVAEHPETVDGYEPVMSFGPRGALVSGAAGAPGRLL
jgi:hypothetical protein